MGLLTDCGGLAGATGRLLSGSQVWRLKAATKRPPQTRGWARGVGHTLPRPLRASTAGLGDGAEPGTPPGALSGRQNGKQGVLSGHVPGPREGRAGWGGTWGRNEGARYTQHLRAAPLPLHAHSRPD